MEPAAAPVLSPELGPEHRWLGRLAGTWRGTATTVYGAAQPDVSPVEIRCSPILGGLFIRADLRGTLDGRPREGSHLIGFDAGRKRFIATWVDSWHNGNNAMALEGRMVDDAVVLEGGFDAGGERWGWRVTIRFVGDGGLRIEDANLSPAGVHEGGIETVLVRT